MYKVVKIEHTKKRPLWLVTLLISMKPSLFGKGQSHASCCMVLRYVRHCVYKLFHHRTADKVYVTEEKDSVTLCNNRRKPCITFKIVKE